MKMEKPVWNLSGVDCGSGGHKIARVLSSLENKISLMAQFQNKNKMKNKSICEELNMNWCEYRFLMAEFIFRSLSKFNAYQRLLRFSFPNFVNLPKLFSPKQFKIFQGHFSDKTYKRLQHQLKQKKFWHHYHFMAWFEGGKTNVFSNNLQKLDILWKLSE